MKITDKKRKAVLAAGVMLGLGIANVAQADGAYCREYTQTFKVAGEVQKGYGTACLQRDGSWKIVSEKGSADIIGKKIVRAKPNKVEKVVIEKRVVKVVPPTPLRVVWNEPRFKHKLRKHVRHGRRDARRMVRYHYWY